MAKVFIEETTLTAIGDAIRGKTGKTDLIDPLDMGAEIEAIEAGGGDLPEEALNLTGDFQQRFCRNGWNWFIETYGNKVKTSNITRLSGAFIECKLLTEVPFVLNVNSANTNDAVFSGCENLVICPKIRGTFINSTSANVSNVTQNCKRLRDIEDLFLPEMFDYWAQHKVTSQYSSMKGTNFDGMYSLRRIPSWWYKFKLNEASTAFPSSSYLVMPTAFQNCYTLDEIANLQVLRTQAAATSNMFNNTFSQCNRLKSITFETNEDGSPVVAQWKSQTIDLTAAVGYKPNSIAYIYDYNSGITVDKRVTDDATYQALKNDPDWFTSLSNYSRYDHDSAVETINSLPDTSAYLASAGGTNTIKFLGSSGSATDGGAINTLTEAEIAVATAKGWTVTLV